jgi:hypothetical protein
MSSVATHHVASKVPALADRKPARIPTSGASGALTGAPREVKHGGRIRFDNRPGSESVIDSPGIAFAARKAA